MVVSVAGFPDEEEEEGVAFGDMTVADPEESRSAAGAAARQVVGSLVGGLTGAADPIPRAAEDPRSRSSADPSSGAAPVADGAAARGDPAAPPPSARSVTFQDAAAEEAAPRNETAALSQESSAPAVVARDTSVAPAPSTARTGRPPPSNAEERLLPVDGVARPADQEDAPQTTAADQQEAALASPHVDALGRGAERARYRAARPHLAAPVVEIVTEQDEQHREWISNPRTAMRAFVSGNYDEEVLETEEGPILASVPYPSVQDLGPPLVNTVDSPMTPGSLRDYERMDEDVVFGSSGEDIARGVEEFSKVDHDAGRAITAALAALSAPAQYDTLRLHIHRVLDATASGLAIDLSKQKLFIEVRYGQDHVVKSTPRLLGLFDLVLDINLFQLANVVRCTRLQAEVVSGLQSCLGEGTAPSSSQGGQGGRFDPLGGSGGGAAAPPEASFLPISSLAGGRLYDGSGCSENFTYVVVTLSCPEFASYEELGSCLIPAAFLYDNPDFHGAFPLSSASGTVGGTGSLVLSWQLLSLREQKLLDVVEKRVVRERGTEFLAGVAAEGEHNVPDDADNGASAASREGVETLDVLLGRGRSGSGGPREGDPPRGEGSPSENPLPEEDHVGRAEDHGPLPPHATSRRGSAEAAGEPPPEAEGGGAPTSSSPRRPGFGRAPSSKNSVLLDGRHRALPPSSPELLSQAPSRRRNEEYPLLVQKNRRHELDFRTGQQQRRLRDSLFFDVRPSMEDRLKHLFDEHARLLEGAGGGVRPLSALRLVAPSREEVANLIVFKAKAALQQIRVTIREVEFSAVVDARGGLDKFLDGPLPSFDGAQLEKAQPFVRASFGGKQCFRTPTARTLSDATVKNFLGSGDVITHVYGDKCDQAQLLRGREVGGGSGEMCGGRGERTLGNFTNFGPVLLEIHREIDASEMYGKGLAIGVRVLRDRCHNNSSYKT